MKIPAFITVRTAASRLPQKCLLPFGDYNVIEHIIHRTKHYQLEPIICTSIDSSDNILEEIIEQKVDNQVKQHLSQQIDLKVEQKVKEILDKINQEMVSEYSQKSKKELISLCKQKGIKKLSALNKPQLIQILEDIKEDQEVQEVQEVQIVQEGKNVYKFIDLFCGIGGFHQALTSLGCECNLACDIDAACRKGYTSNYQLEPCIDVKKIDPEMIEDMDIICGGFPCQAFSNAGNKKMFSDDRGLLFDEIIRIAKVKKPKFMFLENVKHILKVGDGEVIKYIRGKLDMNNYHVYEREEDKSNYLLQNFLYENFHQKVPFFHKNLI